MNRRLAILAAGLAMTIGAAVGPTAAKLHHEGDDDGSEQQPWVCSAVLEGVPMLQGCLGPLDALLVQLGIHPP